MALLEPAVFCPIPIVCEDDGLFRFGTIELFFKIPRAISAAASSDARTQFSTQFASSPPPRFLALAAFHVFSRSWRPDLPSFDLRECVFGKSCYLCEWRIQSPVLITRDRSLFNIIRRLGIVISANPQEDVSFVLVSSNLIRAGHGNFGNRSCLFVVFFSGR